VVVDGVVEVLAVDAAAAEHSPGDDPVGSGLADAAAAVGAVERWRGDGHDDPPS
jgi:hypothetical protein